MRRSTEPPPSSRARSLRRPQTVDAPSAPGGGRTGGRLKAVAVALAVLASVLAGPVEGADWQAAVKLNAGFTTMSGITHRGTLGTGERIGIDIDGEIERHRTEDVTAGVGASLGRRFGPWLLEAEYVWRYRTDWDATAPTPTIQAITNVFTNVRTSTLMLNAGRTGPFSARWLWEAGLGAGAVWNRMRSDYIERAVSGVRPERRFKRADTKTSLAWNLFAGISRAVGQRWRLGLRYRYIDLGELRAGPFEARPARLFANQGAHELQLALTLK
ncbi:MAG: porin family protein [Gammaproteobacteria bacterium]|nr:porin family protein [Gammaproteobacteria bacterium]